MTALTVTLLPCSRSQASISDTVLHDEPAVKPLLRLLEAASATRGAALSYQDVLGLLGSAYAGIDALQLRRLHQELLRLDRSLGEDAPQLSQPDEFAELSRAELLLLHTVTTEGVAEQLQATDLDALAPREALELLYELKRSLD